MHSPVLPGHEPAASAPVGASVTRRFPATTASVGQARRFLLEALPAPCLTGANAVVLMLSELATNAVLHAATSFDVTVSVAPDGGHVRVEVVDGSDGYPAPLEPSSDTPHGRGLHIVRTLADAWGIEMHRGRRGKTVWFSAALTPPSDRSRADDGTCASVSGSASPDEGAPWTSRSVAAGSPLVRERAAGTAGAFGAGGTMGAAGMTGMPAMPAAWPPPSVRAVLDGLRDAVVATDEHGEIHYVNRAAEELMGWPHGSLVGRSALDLVPDSLRAAFDEGFAHFVRAQAEELVGQRLSTPIRCADGSEVDTELVLSVFDHPHAGAVVVGIFRPHDHRKLQRWSELTSELLEILIDAPIDDAPAERLLATLGRRLDWDVTTLWALSADHELVCRHVWTRSPTIAPAFTQEKAADPRSGSEGLPRWVVEHGEPMWAPDLRRDRRFVTAALAKDGLVSAYAFPIRYRGACIGVVKMLSRHQRERDPSVVELMEAVGGHLGELLHASTLAAEREHLLDELLEARRRNEFLLLATQVLSEVVDYHEMVDRLAQVAVPVLADICLIDIADEDGQMRRMAAWHADPSKRSLAEELRTQYPPDPEGDHPTMAVMHSGRSMWSAEMTDEFLRTTSRDERHYSILKLLGFTSYMTVPLRLRDEEVVGTVSLVSAGSGRRFSEKDLGLAEQLAKQVSSVVIRARAYDRERRISHDLQRNLLPDAIPAITGWEVAARYLPAALGYEVGGDWYDVVEMADGLVAFVVGDVEGHDLGAAKIMSRLRHTLGMLVLEERDPGMALERLNRISLSRAGERLATALVGVLDTASGIATFSSAGHHSPVRVGPGQAIELPVPPGPPFGVQPCHYKNHEFELGDDCLVMFTDGLVERRSAHLDERLALLESSLRSSPSTEPARIADHVIDAMTADERRSDDIVVLTARRRGDDLVGQPFAV